MVYNGYKVIDVDNDENFDNSYELETGGNLDIYYFCVGQADCILLTNDGENIEINKLDINLDGNENRILFN